MSVRPQPVTASVKPAGYYERRYPGMRPSSHVTALVMGDRNMAMDEGIYDQDGMSSAGSTDSLTSILQHDSYQSGLSSGAEMDECYDYPHCQRSVNPDTSPQHTIDRVYSEHRGCVERASSHNRTSSDQKCYTEVKPSTHSISSGDRVGNSKVYPKNRRASGGTTYVSESRVVSASKGQKSTCVTKEFVPAASHWAGGGADPCYIDRSRIVSGKGQVGDRQRRIIARKVPVRGDEKCETESTLRPRNPFTQSSTSWYTGGMESRNAAGPITKSSMYHREVTVRSRVDERGGAPRHLRSSSESCGEDRIKRETREPRSRTRKTAPLQTRPQNPSTKPTPITPHTQPLNTNQSNRHQSPAITPRQCDTRESKTSLSSTASSSYRSHISSKSDSLAGKETESKDQGDKKEDPSGVDIGQLTAWEEWLLEKEKKNRLIQKKEKDAQAREEEKAKQKEKEAEERKNKNLLKFEEWKIEKQKRDKEKIRQEKVRQRMETEKEEEEKRRQLAKADEKYHVWMEEKKKHEDKLKRETEEQSEKRNQEEAEKKRKADIAYRKWQQEATQRHVTAPYSYGYSDGKLTGYYDKTSNPPPTFINPRPWVHPDIPTPQKATKQRSKSAGIRRSTSRRRQATN